MTDVLNSTPENVARDQTELFDLVDDNDKVIGTITRDEALRGNVKNVRIVVMFIRNSAGDLLVPKRTANKRIAPNGLDFSVAGYVQSGESYDIGMMHEYQEETGLVYDASKVRLLKVLSPFSINIHGFMAVYEITTDAEPQYNPDDFVSWEWLSPSVLLARLQAGEAHKSDLLPVVQHIYGS